MNPGEDGRRAVIHAFGETPPEAIDALVIEPQPFPDVDARSPTDVVIRIGAAQVNWVDLLMTSGQYQHLPSPPYVPGLEYAGTVAWIGSEVTGTVVGDRVIADGFATGPRSLGPHQAWGGFATWAVAPASALFALPDGLSFAEGCSVYGGYETAYHCLVHRGRLTAGETVLVHGASGTTGLAAVQMAKGVGATVIATGRSADKLATVAAEGADHVLTIGDGEGGIRRFRDDVKALTGGHGVDVVYDGVGGDVSLESLRCIRFGGRYLIVGWAATPFVARGRGGRGAPRANVLPTNLLLVKSLDVLGCPAVISVHKTPSIRQPRLAHVQDWVGRGVLRPRVGRTYPLDQVADAMRAKWRSEVVGTVVVEP